jgi:hypothetical protein
VSNAPQTVFASVLHTCREEINARFALMRREFADLEPEAYFAFLRSSGEAVVGAVSAADPTAAVETGCAVCETGLELVARNLAGPGARQHWMDEAWARVLTAAARLVATEPRRVIGAVSNAVHQLATTQGTRPAQWVKLMETAASLADDAGEFLRAGQVAAWRCGLAHYREGALTAAAQLPAALALAALGAQGDAAALLEQLRQDVWHHPAAPQKGPRLVARAGAFRGFGGTFALPPVISLLHGQWLATSGEDHWLITADAFGATFHRVTGQSIPPPLPVPRQLPPGVTVPADCGQVTSLATSGSTTAVTAALTHAVLFFQAA